MILRMFLVCGMSGGFEIVVVDVDGWLMTISVRVLTKLMAYGEVDEIMNGGDWLELVAVEKRCAARAAAPK